MKTKKIDEIANLWYKLVEEFANDGFNYSKRRVISINSCHKAGDGTYIFIGRSKLHGSVRYTKTKTNRLR